MNIPHEWQTVLAAIQTRFPGAIIGGGALRDTLLDREVKDVDIFIQMPDDLTDAELCDVLSKLTGQHFERSLPERVVNYVFGSGSDVACVCDGGLFQVIATWTPTDPTTAMMRFDFGICRIIYDGINLIRSADFDKDVEDKTFTLLRCNSVQELARSMERWTRLKEKYDAYRLVILEETNRLYGPVYDPGFFTVVSEVDDDFLL